MVVDCAIKFENNPKLIFYASQTVSGIIEVTVDKPVKIQKLRLYIKGSAECKWSESESSSDSHASNSTTYTGTEIYMESTTYLISSIATIQPGKHMYNFMCVLPNEVPTSVEEEQGFIRYTASVILERPWKFDLKYTTGLTVIKHIDLNTLPALGMPLQMEVSKTFNCLFCSSQPMIMQVNLPISGFVAGQMVNMTIIITNPTSTTVEYVEIKFVKIVNYTSDFPRTKTQTDFRTIHKDMCVGSIVNGIKTYDKQFLVPLLSPSTLNKCRVVDVSYHVHVKAKVSGCHKSPVIKFPVVIGTIPFREVHTPQPTAQSNEFVSPSAPDISNFNNFEGESSYEPPPPTYEELMKTGRIEINRGEDPSHLINNQSYSPSYPYYNLPNPIGFNIQPARNTKL